MNVEVGKEIIKILLDVFNKHNSKFFLEHGTLLGFARHGKFISYDNDMDFGIEYINWNEKIVPDLCQLGFKNIHTSVFRGDSLKFVGKHKDHKICKIRFAYKSVHFCLEIYHEGIDQYKDYMYYWPPKEASWVIQIPKTLLVPQIKKNFYNMEIFVPKNYWNFLNFIYGYYWRIPIKNYYGSELYKENSKRFKRYL